MRVCVCVCVCVCARDCVGCRRIGDCCHDYVDFCSDFVSTAAVTTTTAPVTAECEGTISVLAFVGDGYCDSIGNYNTLLCGWDGGDCCADRCVDGPTHVCGAGADMVCFDPGSSSYLPFEQRSCEDVVAKFAWVGDGMCDFEGLYNTAKCSWDGGDCCSSTCVSSEMGFECFSSQFHCLDVDASDYGSGSGLCIVDYEEWLGDGG